MRAMKLVSVFGVVLALLAYAPAYYGSWQFESFVEQATGWAGARGELKRILMTEARNYGAVLQGESINITTDDSVLRVSVDYSVPVNFYIFEHEWAFHAVASAPAYAR
jgi:hypothetical protein